MKAGNETQKDNIGWKFFRFIKYNKTFVVFLIVLISLVIYALFGQNGLVERISMQNEKVELEKKLREENERTDELHKEIEALQNSDKKLEEVAREKYGMTKEGEVIYRVEIDSNKNIPDE